MQRRQSLRPYQHDCLQAIKQSWQTSFATLAVLATGGGKTTIMSELIVDLMRAKPVRVVAIAHRQELIYQMKERISNQFDALPITPHIGVMMANEHEPEADIIIGTIQTLRSKRAENILEHGPVDYLIIDEAHHAIAGSQYERLLSELRLANPDLHTVGFTATPRRTDGISLKPIFGQVCYTWGLLEGIKSGYLVHGKRIAVKTLIALDEVRQDDEDYIESDLAAYLETQDWDVVALDAYKNHILNSERSCLAYFPSVKLSQSFVNNLNTIGVTAAHVDSTTAKRQRQEIWQAFKAGEIACVSNMNILLEGVDAPSASAILLARPTRSQTLMTQIVGRGLRIHPNKENCLVIDLTTGKTKVMTNGKMDVVKPPEAYCKACDTYYPEHFDRCPYCGYQSLDAYYETDILTDPRPRGVIPYRTFDEVVSLFEDLRGSWHLDQESEYIAVDLGYGRGTLVIIPTPPELVACVSETFDLGRYALLHVREGDVQLMWSSMDIEILMMEADYMAFGPNGIAQRGMHTHAHWRSEMASVKQVGYLRHLGVPEDQLVDVDKGKASQLISYYKSRRDLERFLATGHISVRQSQPFMIQQSLF